MLWYMPPENEIEEQEDFELTEISYLFDTGKRRFGNKSPFALHLFVHTAVFKGE